MTGQEGLMPSGSEHDKSGAAFPSSPCSSSDPAESGLGPLPPDAAAGDLSPDELQEKLTEILHRISGTDPAQITAQARLIEDIGIDSLGFYEILIEADECLGIKIREDDLLNFRTVGDIQDHLRNLERPDAEAT
jgi:acyl carrier protein